MEKRYGISIAIVFFLVQLMLLPRAGMTWDEPSSFFFGRANLKFWLTGNRAYLTDIRSAKLFADSPFPYIYGEDLYSPFSFVIASIFSYVGAESFHILSVINAHHLGEIFLGSIGIFAFYGIAIEIGFSSSIAAGITVLFGLYPTIFGQMRSDAKDIPLMSMLVVFVYCFFRLLRSLKKKNFTQDVGWAIVTGVAFGFAIATKVTAPIILIPFGLWSLFAVRPLKRFIPLSLLVGLVGGIVFFLCWPLLWDRPWAHLMQIWQLFRVVGLGMPVQYFGHTYQAGMNLPKLFPFVILLIQTPIGVTLLAVFGMYFALHNRRGFLFLLWFWLGMGRFFLPGIIIYAKVRHFIDVMPAFFILVGFGLQKIFTLNKKIVYAILFVFIAQEIVISMQFFPYEPSYFNFLVGGTSRVAKENLFDVEYWGSTVAEGMAWIQKQPGQKVVYACGMKHLAYFYKDATIRLSSTPDIGDYVLVPNAYSWFGGPKNVYGAAGKPLYVVSRAGADLLYIYRITSATWWCGYETDSTV